MLDVRDRLLEQLADVVVVEVVDDPSAVALPDDQPEVAQQAQLMGHRDAPCPRRSASSLTEQAPAWRRPRMRTRLGVASACIVCATTPANSGSSCAGSGWVVRVP